MPEGTCAVTLGLRAPEQRGELGLILLADGNGGRRRSWQLRCPWCRELVELEEARIGMQAGKLAISGPVTCGRCSARFTVADGVARRRG